MYCDIFLSASERDWLPQATLAPAVHLTHDIGRQGAPVGQQNQKSAQSNSLIELHALLIN